MAELKSEIIWERGSIRIVKVTNKNSDESYGFERNYPDLLGDPSWRMEEKVTSANSPFFIFLEWFGEYKS